MDFSQMTNEEIYVHVRDAKLIKQATEDKIQDCMYELETRAGLRYAAIDKDIDKDIERLNTEE